MTAALIIILVFAVKTRQKINAYGKDNILWRRVKVVEDPEAVGDVEAWVSEGGPAFLPLSFVQNIFTPIENSLDCPTESLVILISIDE